MVNCLCFNSVFGTVSEAGKSKEMEKVKVVLFLSYGQSQTETCELSGKANNAALLQSGGPVLLELG